MTLLSRFLLLAIVLLSTVHGLSVESAGAQGAWGREATSLVDLVGRIGIRSSDARKVAFIQEDGGGLSVVMDGRRPPHSSCPEMGKIRGYLVEVPSGKIIREYAERDLRARWGWHLGYRFGPPKP